MKNKKQQFARLSVRYSCTSRSDVKKKKLIMFALVTVRRNSDFNNKYTLRTILGQDVFRAEEATTLCARDCCGPDRAFHMNIVDLHGRPVIALERPPWLNVCCCCPVLPICQQVGDELTLLRAPGMIVFTMTASARQDSFCVDDYSGTDGSTNGTARMEGRIDSRTNE